MTNGAGKAGGDAGNGADSLSGADNDASGADAAKIAGGTGNASGAGGVARGAGSASRTGKVGGAGNAGGTESADSAGGSSGGASGTGGKANGAGGAGNAGKMGGVSKPSTAGGLNNANGGESASGAGSDAGNARGAHGAGSDGGANSASEPSIALGAGSAGGANGSGVADGAKSAGNATNTGAPGKAGGINIAGGAGKTGAASGSAASAASSASDKTGGADSASDSDAPGNAGGAGVAGSSGAASDSAVSAASDGASALDTASGSVASGAASDSAVSAASDTASGLASSAASGAASVTGSAGGTDSASDSGGASASGAASASAASAASAASGGAASASAGASGAFNRHIAMSSRVRLARNFSGALFPGRIKRDQAKALLRKAKDAFFASPDINAKDYVYVEMQQLDSIDKMMLVEKRLVSPDLITGDRPSAAIVSKDEALSVMLNEEDHLRIQCIVQSAGIDAAYEACCRVDRIFDKSFEIAFDQSLGYLTSCPTNLGTGMRASFMLHLPALVMTGHIKGILEACGKIGVAVRGIYGENSETSGSMFQFSNQGSLGRNEEEIIASVKNVASQIAGHESRLRQELAQKSPIQFQDRVYRAYGILQNARVLTSEEFMRMWSDVRLGVDMGTIRDISIKRLDRLLTLVQPAYIQKMFGRMLNSEERDVHRAALVREKTREGAKA
jgi:protein arginine kinase